MIEIKSTFQAESLNILNFFTQHGKTGYYIPAYQRPYSWSDEKVKKLIEDITLGLYAMNENPQSLSFIGTLILVKDEGGRTVFPSFRNQLPNNVFLLIDGQQRVSTLVTLSVILSHMLEVSLRSFKSEQTPAHEWLMNVTKRSITNLKNIYSVDVEEPEEDYEYLAIYPRVIRAELDQWSRHNGEAKYASPISALIHNKILLDKHQIENDDFLNFIKSISDPFVTEAIKEMKKCFETIQKNDGDDDHETFVSQVYYSIAQKHDLLKALFHRLPITEDEFDSIGTLMADPKGLNLFKLLCFTNYFLDRVCITSVFSTSESYAFDMFESLNTSGELLTSFETFKPLVVRHVTQRDYLHSDSARHINTIEKLFFRADGDPEKKVKLTNELIGAFSLAEDGTKPSNHLSQQRRMLKKYEVRSDKHAFLAHLASTARFLDECWYDSTLPPTMLNLLEPSKVTEASLYLHVLRDCNHKQCIPVLVRFYHRFIQATDQVTAVEFYEAIKCCLHFYVLWRGCTNSTDQIDSAIKSLFMGTISVDRKGETLARFNEEGTRNCSAHILKGMFRSLLASKGIDNQEYWVNKLKSTDAYSNKKITKFMLFLTSTYFSIENNTFEQQRTPSMHYMTKENWTLPIEIEHIAPITKNMHWDENIYSRASTVNELGNLSLLVKKANASAGNKPWVQKKAMYSLIKENNAASFRKLKEEFQDIFTEANLRSIEASNFSALVNNIPLVDSWNKDTIENRTSAIGNALYPILMRAFI